MAFPPANKLYKGSAGQWSKIQKRQLRRETAVALPLIVLNFGALHQILRAEKYGLPVVGCSLQPARFTRGGTIANYFAIDPRWPWAMFVAGGVTAIGLQGCWLMIDSMVADVCDDDELKTGRRREGMFSAVKGFALKDAQGITFGIGGYMATAAGYDPAVVDASGLDEATAVRMKIALKR